jgi:nucleotide-binding universal stress UspA family protein
MSAPIIMAPLDGSPAAEAALPWAVHLARRTNGAVRLVGVHAPPAVLLDGETLIGSVVPDASIRQRETEYFAETQARLRAMGVEVSADLLDGSVITSLADYARQLKPTWIVMLSHARGRLARFFLGETAAEFVRESPSPVLLVHPGESPPDPSIAPAIRHVLVPLDGSTLAERMLEPAADLAGALGADLTLIMALAAVPDIEAIARRQEPALTGKLDPAAAKTKAERYLASTADRIRTSTMKVECRVIPKGSAADVIVNEAEAHSGTVIALATHGRGGLAKLVWGSVADEVTRRTKAPVLVLRPSDK